MILKKLIKFSSPQIETDMKSSAEEVEYKYMHDTVSWMFEKIES